MPSHLKDYITEKNVRCLKNGLVIYFNSLLPDDFVQVHFLISWSSAKKKINRYLEYSIGQSHNQLIKQTGFS